MCRVQVTMGKAGAWKERASGETERERKRKIKRQGINPIPWMSKGYVGPLLSLALSCPQEICCDSPASLDKMI